VSLGSATWLASYPGYALSPLRALRARRVLAAVRRMSPPERPAQPAVEGATSHRGPAGP
jgi:hypothetical protein